MYLAPFNYDRFFERAFSDLNVAKQFLEDLLKTKIETIELLSRKKKITDDAAFVEFDFRCKINGEYVIVDMQQWYKQDVVKRFYLYFCNNTSLQLEKIPALNVPGRNGKVYKTKNYNVLEPSITVIWMANDDLGFEDNIIAFSVFPEMLNDFIRNEALWATNNQENLFVERKKILAILDNKTKGLDFLPKNRLIYAFQPNIAKHIDLGFDGETYQNWFDFAEKTRNKDNKESDFEKFKEIPVFKHLMEILKTSTMTQDDFQYITDQVEYERGMEVYNNKIRQEGRDFTVREYEPIVFMLRQATQKAEENSLKLEQEKQKAEENSLKLEQEKQKLEQEKQKLEQEKQKAEEEKQKAEQEKQKAEQEKQKAEQEKQKAEQEKQKAEQEKQKAEENSLKLEQEKQNTEQKFKLMIRKFLKKGDSVEDIAELLETDMSTITGFLEQIKIEDEAVKS